MREGVWGGSFNILDIADAKALGWEPDSIA